VIALAQINVDKYIWRAIQVYIVLLKGFRYSKKGFAGTPFVPKVQHKLSSIIILTINDLKKGILWSGDEREGIRLVCLSFKGGVSDRRVFNKFVLSNFYT
jgi:hypothetical protein